MLVDIQRDKLESLRSVCDKLQVELAGARAEAVETTLFLTRLQESLDETTVARDILEVEINQHKDALAEKGAQLRVQRNLIEEQNVLLRHGATQALILSNPTTPVPTDPVARKKRRIE